MASVADGKSRFHVFVLIRAGNERQYLSDEETTEPETDHETGLYGFQQRARTATISERLSGEGKRSSTEEFGATVEDATSQESTKHSQADCDDVMPPIRDAEVSSGEVLCSGMSLNLCFTAIAHCHPLLAHDNCQAAHSWQAS